jgi:porphobilinogen synthase
MLASATVDRRALIQPHFVLPGNDREEPIAAMPGIARMTVDRLLRQVEADLELGIDKVLVFGVPEAKDRPRAARAPATVSRRRRSRRSRRSSAATCSPSPTCVCARTRITDTAAC